ncbi:Phosphoribulokinase / Uridine kinase family protein [human gut metagenome]|uniref:Phosphoribulokinase / Uridine kinase family protein n=1 Tax=human gut metagenome TaxID=408170 RepID=K1RW91_9ZZZZ
MDNIKITINDKEFYVKRKTTLAEIANEFQSNYHHPILIAKVNNTLKELNYEITKPKNIEFLDLTSREGNKIHVNALIFILVVSIKELYGAKYDIRVQHSIDKGLYIETNFEITEKRLNDIKEKMNKIIAEERPITKLNVDRLEARDYFSKIGDKAKVNILKYTTNTYITLYKLGEYYDYFYTKMPINTKQVPEFDLTYLQNNGLVLRFPTVYINNQIKDYENHPNMFRVFNECHAWGELMHIKNAADLNALVSTGKVEELIRISETKQSNELLQLAEKIYNNKDLKIVLLAGPSSSGKTTTSKKLCMFLRSFGVNPAVISMDDYFVEREETPLNEEGKPDYECLEAVDLKLFDNQIEKILKGEEVFTPTYNFLTGNKEYNNKIKLGNSDVLVIEGIHALDKRVLTNISKNKIFRIYISALTELNIDNHNYISTTDNRLLRRIIRDNKTRGHGVQRTISTWPDVRSGEEKYIFPYQDNADYTFNSALIYEIGVLKTYAEPLLYAVDPSDSCYEEAKRLINFLGFFLPIPADAIPKDSILREFVGGSFFK